MATTIITKNGTSGTPTGLADGELAVDRAAGKLWVGHAGGVTPIVGGALEGGTADGQTLRWEADDSEWQATSALVVDDAGNVGIGTTAPADALQVGDGSGNAIMRLDGADTGGANFIRGTRAGVSEFLFGSRSAVVADAKGALVYAYDTDPITLYAGGVERMRINSNGNVGINQSFPTVKLQIKTVTATNETAIRISDDITQTLNIKLDGTANTGGVHYENPNVGYQRWTTANTERMRIDSSGNVGIGTNNPSQLLAVRSSVEDSTVPINGVLLEALAGSTSHYLPSLSWGYSGGATLFSSIQTVRGSTGGEITFSTGLGSLTSLDEHMRIDTSGNLLVGTTTQVTGAAEGLQLGVGGSMVIRTSRPSTVAIAHIEFRNPNGRVGQIQTQDTTTSYVTTSDERLKKNIQDAGDPFTKINAIQVREFDWKADDSHQDFGFIAQELVEVAPEAVSQGETEEDTWGVDPSKLVPVLVKAIQEQQAMLVKLTARLEALESA